MNNGVALLIFLIVGLLYFLPSFIAFVGAKRNGVAIFALNLLLGWTGLGWIVAFIWALTVDVDEPEPGRYITCIDPVDADGRVVWFDTETQSIVDVTPRESAGIPK